MTGPALLAGLLACKRSGTCLSRWTSVHASWLYGCRGTGIRQLATQATKGPRQLRSLFLSHLTQSSGHSARAPLTLGLMNWLESQLPHVGFFVPIGSKPFANSTLDIDHHAELVHKVFGVEGDPDLMVGVTEADAAQLIARGQQADLFDQIYAAYAAYRDAGHEFVLIQGASPHMGGTEMDAQLAQALGAPVLMTMTAGVRSTPPDLFNHAMLKRQVFQDHKVDVVGVALNLVPAAQHTQVTAQLRQRFEAGGLPFAGALPHDPLLSSVRLDEVQAALGATQLFGECPVRLDREFSEVVIGTQRIDELMEVLDGKDRKAPPLVVTSHDRTDVLLALLASQLSMGGPTVAGVLLTSSGRSAEARKHARDMTRRIFLGIEQSYQGQQMPVLATDLDLYEAMTIVRSLEPALLPSSSRKIAQSKVLFERYMDMESVMSRGATLAKPPSLTPKMFTHNLKTLCMKNPQRIVLPESSDKRVLTAAAEVTQRGLAKITLLGKPEAVLADASKLGLDLSGVSIVDPQNSDRLDKYVDALVEARKKKALPRPTAMDMVKDDVNMFGVMAVACGDADGMVSGAIHTTAATIRPAMQVLKQEGANVSSVFFMCLPDRVLVYGDCAVNVSPSAQELAQIAIVSADTAAAFGLEPRVAMLSYSTLGSGSGPDVQKVVQAVKLVHELRGDLKVEGPIQYDAAIDPKVAAVKIKTPSEVAGKATVYVFPDLNTGNVVYKAVQQSTGAIAMGPVMQGLTKPVNDLSRGCTVPDIVNTICVTSIQAMQAVGKQ